AYVVDGFLPSILRRARHAAVAAVFFMGAPLGAAQDNSIQGADADRRPADGSKPPVLAQSEKLPAIIVPPTGAKHNPNKPPKQKRTTAEGVTPTAPAIARAPDSLGGGFVKMPPVAGSDLAIGKVPGAVSTITAADIARSDAVPVQEALQTGV